MTYVVIVYYYNYNSNVQQEYIRIKQAKPTMFFGFFLSSLRTTYTQLTQQDWPWYGAKHSVR